MEARSLLITCSNEILNISISLKTIAIVSLLGTLASDELFDLIAKLSIDIMHHPLDYGTVLCFLLTIHNKLGDIL